MEISGGGTDQLRIGVADVLVDLEELERAEEIANSLDEPIYATLIRGRIHLARNEAEQALRAFEPELPAQPLDLAHAQAQLLGSLRLGQPALQHPPKNLQPIQLLAAHRQASRVVHAGPPGIHRARDPTLLMVRNPTFLHCVYIHTAGK